MAIRVLKLGSERVKNEGVRIGTVRRPPRGVPKTDYSSKNWYDVWLPNLSPRPETIKMGKAAKTDKQWQAFAKKYQAEMATPDPVRIIELLAALSHHTNFSVGCYCENEARCHRSILKEVLIAKGAKIVSDDR